MPKLSIDRAGRVVLLEPLLANPEAGETMAYGVPMFQASHGDLAATGTAPSVASLAAARLSMQRMRRPQGEPLAVVARLLIFPPELQALAEQLLASITAARLSDANPFSGSLEIVVEPGLVNLTTWYLAAGPRSYDRLLLGHLEGWRASDREQGEVEHPGR